VAGGIRGVADRSGRRGRPGRIPHGRPDDLQLIRWVDGLDAEMAELEKDVLYLEKLLDKRQAEAWRLARTWPSGGATWPRCSRSTGRRRASSQEGAARRGGAPCQPACGDAGPWPSSPRIDDEHMNAEALAEMS
jgi:hypothetical protein